MGGPGASSSRTKKFSSSNFQKCDMNSHQADECPFIYSACKRVGCQGIRKLLVAKTEANTGKKFLACQFTTCKSFEWLDAAISEMQRTGVAPKQHVAEGCFQCGAKDHWHIHCPWTNRPCEISGWKGARVLRISSKKATDGEKFLQCSVCKDMQWLKEAIVDMEYYETQLDNMNAKLKGCALGEK